MKDIILLLSCEHAVNTVPEPYQTAFAADQLLLDSHRGYDQGALKLAQHLKAAFQCDFIQGTVSRLLIDCNRSLSHPHCFSEFSKPFSTEIKEQLTITYYLPYREKLQSLIKQYLAQGLQVCHLSIHSFTPVLNERIREADLGLLYDPRRLKEKNLAKQWQQQLKQQEKQLRVRLNYPYHGKSDGFTSALRKQYAEENYLGLEIEMNQLFASEERSLLFLATILAKTLSAVLP